MSFSAVVAQDYRTEADNAFIIRGNSALLECEVPSFVADFVKVVSWTDSEGNAYHPGRDYGNSDSGQIISIHFELCQTVIILEAALYQRVENNCLHPITYSNNSKDNKFIDNSIVYPESAAIKVKYNRVDVCLIVWC